MFSKSLQYGAWVLSSVALLATAVQLRRGGHLPRLRFFFSYLVIAGFHGGIDLLLSFTNPLWWFYSFYIGNVITTLLGFVVLYEVAIAAVSTPKLKIDRSTFLGLCAMGAVLAVAAVAVTEVEAHYFLRVRILLEVGLRVAQVTILAIFVGISSLFGLFWRRVEFGIVLGYGLYASSQLAVMYLRASGTPVSQTLFSIVPVVSYCVSSFVWLVYSSVADPVIRTNTEPLLLEVRKSHAVIERIAP